MSDNRLTHLKIDEEFKKLIPPLSVDEKIVLEESILTEGCREPICIWRGFIIDGHNRYEICCKHQIPFTTRTLPLLDKDEVISWICINQLGRRNISDETRKYLIGKRYESEKKIGIRNISGNNQFVTHNDQNVSARSTAHKLGDEYHMCHQTVTKYGVFAKAIDEIRKKDPNLAPKILSGDVKISHDNLVTLSKSPVETIEELNNKISEDGQNFVRYKDCRDKMKSQLEVEVEPIMAIKQMPAYDPDAELSSLSFTIPTWINSMERVMRVADMTKSSEAAKLKLSKIVSTLIECAFRMQDRLEEKNNE